MADLGRLTLLTYSHLFVGAEVIPRLPTKATEATSFAWRSEKESMVGETFVVKEKKACNNTGVPYVKLGRPNSMLWAFDCDWVIPILRRKV